MRFLTSYSLTEHLHLSPSATNSWLNYEPVASVLAWCTSWVSMYLLTTSQPFQLNHGKQLGAHICSPPYTLWGGGILSWIINPHADSDRNPCTANTSFSQHLHQARIYQVSAGHFREFEAAFALSALGFQLPESQRMHTHGAKYRDYTHFRKFLIILFNGLICLSKPHDEVRKYMVFSEDIDRIFQAFECKIKRRFLAVFIISSLSIVSTLYFISLAPASSGCGMSLLWDRQIRLSGHCISSVFYQFSRTFHFFFRWYFNSGCDRNAFHIPNLKASSTSASNSSRIWTFPFNFGNRTEFAIINAALTHCNICLLRTVDGIFLDCSRTNSFPPFMITISPYL